MAVRFALLAGSVLVSAPLAANAGYERMLSPEPTSYRGLACETDETRVFAGDVEDDFGLSIAVCVRDQTLTIRYSDTRLITAARFRGRHSVSRIARPGRD